MSLKEDYKNDKFAGMRKYQLTNNADGTVSLNDVTQYQTSGDIFTADDMNATNKVVNKMQLEDDTFRREITEAVSGLSSVVKTITGEKILVISASRWSSTLPHTQEIAFPGMKESDVPIYGLRLSGTLSNVTVENQKRVFGYIDRYASGSGKVTLYCYSKKPDIDVTVCVKGV